MNLKTSAVMTVLLFFPLNLNAQGVDSTNVHELLVGDVPVRIGMSRAELREIVERYKMELGGGADEWVNDRGATNMFLFSDPNEPFNVMILDFVDDRLVLATNDRAILDDGSDIGGLGPENFLLAFISSMQTMLDQGIENVRLESLEYEVGPVTRGDTGEAISSPGINHSLDFRFDNGKKMVSLRWSEDLSTDPPMAGGFRVTESMFEADTAQ